MFTLDVECHMVFMHQRTVQSKGQGLPAGRTPYPFSDIRVHSSQPRPKHIGHVIPNVMVMGGLNILESGVAEAEGETKVEPLVTQGLNIPLHVNKGVTSCNNEFLTQQLP